MEHTHEGHRQRMRERVLANGPESLKPHELVEFLLFYAIPRRNLNPLAHQLMDHFGTLQSLFSAPKEELMQVDGVSESTAEFLRLMGAAVLEYTQPDAKPVYLRNRKQTRQYLQQFFAEPGMEDCWLFCLNTTGCLTHSLPLNDTPTWYSPEHMRKAMSQALRCRAHSIILARRQNPCLLTDEDCRHSDELMIALSRIDIALVDHVVIDSRGEITAYATDPKIAQRYIASPSALLAHWLDEE